MLYLSIVEGLGGKPLIRIFFRACFLLNMSLFSLYISSCLFVSLYLSAFVRPALFVLTHFSRYCVCIAPSFFRISRTVISWNFSNTSLWISPAWKSMLHESLRNFALARSPETARFSGRLEHPMYIFSVWGDAILKIMPSRKLILSFKLGREKNIFVKFVFIKGWKKSEQTPPFLKTMKTCVENLKIVQGWSSAAIRFEFVHIRTFDEDPEDLFIF